MNKIVPLKDLAGLKGKVVLCHGCFDFLHYGHIEHLRQAKEMGDILVVTITADEFIQKGPGRPHFTEAQRALHLAALAMVDYVAIVYEPTGLMAIETIRPTIYCKGEEYSIKKDPIFELERQAVEKYGGKVAFTTGEIASSSHLLNLEFSMPWLSQIRAKYSYPQVEDWLDKGKDLLALVIGEKIIDEYIFVAPKSASPKDSMVTFNRVDSKRYSGGGSIVAGHVLEFCKVDYLGKNSLTKSRYVLEPFYAKLFSVSNRDNVSSLTMEDLPQFDDYNFVVVTDFGLGLLSNEVKRHIEKNSRFLCLTVQANSFNFGYNVISQWHRADYVVLDEGELRLSYRDKESDLRSLMKQEAQRLGTKYLTITQGHKGAVIYNGSEFHEIPALANRIVDRLGAGDAFFGSSAILAYEGVPTEIIGLVASIGAAIKIETLGNVVVKKETIKKWLQGIFK